MVFATVTIVIVFVPLRCFTSRQGRCEPRWW